MWWPIRLAGDRGGRPRGVLWVWAAWDALLLRLLPLREVRPGSIVRFRVATYGGPETRLAGGRVVRRGDHIVEIHLDDPAVVARASAGATPHRALRAIADDVSLLRALAASGALGDVRAIHGTSLLATPAVDPSAERRALPRSLGSAFVHYFFVGLVALHHPRGWSAARRFTQRWPAELWIPLDPQSGRH
ncbi:MAG: hypothetical protein KGJ98_02440 [Chloroflexota bacterium]|nr:hypothetical protein [Chloroflexota bacterium]